MGGICSSFSAANSDWSSPTTEISRKSAGSSMSIRTIFSNSKGSDSSVIMVSPSKTISQPFKAKHKQEEDRETPHTLRLSKESIIINLKRRVRRRNPKIAQLKKQFENIMKFFDLSVHDNVFENVNAIINYFDQNKSKEEVSMKLSKIVFDSYNRDKRGWLDASDLKKFCKDLLYMCGHTNITDKDVNDIVERLQNLIRAQNYQKLSFELFWSSNIMKGAILNAEGQLDESNVVFNPHLSTEQLMFIGNLKSRELKKEFDWFFTFFDFKPTGNLLRDISLFMTVLTNSDYDSPSPFFDTKEITTVQRKLQSRLLRYIFEYYDKDGSGVIERNELVDFIQDVQEALYKNSDVPEDEDNISELVDEMLHDCDVDGDGNISYHEILPHLPSVFVRMRSQIS
ncbi:hypothetical protein C9374_012778 [Naegleria lovaniensis]|uniref:EF-hand domain-containing protein n=1 Tax=Naegleria lovaniensis TaxID=51637 RepID=A0AA88KEE5_NAELO|nr:uncharacterized protein C9374_012778 [Naegleria lovaniensis]KAG2373176.1 hypothetical protein C9374_012778 [Naegleria lovaniensis]